MACEQLRIEAEAGPARLTFTHAARGTPTDGGPCARIGQAGVRRSAESGGFGHGGDIGGFVHGLPRSIGRWTAGLRSGIARSQRVGAPLATQPEAEKPAQARSPGEIDAPTAFAVRRKPVFRGI